MVNLVGLYHAHASLWDQFVGYFWLIQSIFHIFYNHFHKFQGLPVFYLVLTHKRYELHDYLAFSGRFVYPNDIHDEDKEYYNICSNHIDVSLGNFFRKSAMLLIAGVVAGMWPAYQSLSQGKIITALELKIPYAAENSYAELFGNMYIEFNIFAHGLLAYFSIEVGMDIIDDFVTLCRKLLEYRMRKLYIRNGKRPSAKVILKLRDIVLHLEHFNGFDMKIFIDS